MNQFNPDQYRNALREKLGVKNMPMHKKVDFIRPVVSSIAQDSAEFGGGMGEAAPAPAVTPAGTGIPQADILAAGGAPEGGEEVNQEQIAPAMALLHTLLQSVDEQTHGENDKVTGVMWRSLHNYIWKNRNKIAKKMMDDAQ
jgi:hypothetical protein